MNDLISRQAAIDEIAETVVRGESLGYALAEDILYDIPSVQPRKGKWVYGEHDVAMCDGYRCDKCGFFVPWDYQHKFIDFIKDYRFCPNCGADMRRNE